MSVHIKRVYDAPDDSDGERVLVDRLWPRGLTKDAARIDHWLKDVAPSSGLRAWFGHRPERWDEFKRRYFRELDAKSADIDRLHATARRRRVTLLFGTRDMVHNNAAALQEYLSRS